MKSYNLIQRTRAVILFSACLLCNAACINEIGTEVTEGDIPITFKAKVKSAPTTKVTNNLFDSGDKVGLYAMLGISFFMSIMYPTQFSLALRDLGEQTKSGSAFLVMAIVGNACLPQFTAYLMHVNEHLYQVAYVVPMVCFLFCAYYGWKGYIVKDYHLKK